MSSDASSTHEPVPPGRAASSQWLHARALWAGLSIMTMWLAVLFVGVFGGDIVSTSGAAGSSASVPVVVVLLPFVLPATISVGRRGFTSAPVELQTGTGEETRAHEEPMAESPGIQAKAA